MARRPAASARVFRPRDVEDKNPHSVYHCYSEDDTLLYIGVAYDVTHRIYMHEAAWHASTASTLIAELGGIDHWTAEEFPTKAAARDAERRAIAAGRPLVNRQHNPSRWTRKCGQYVPSEDTQQAIDRLISKRRARIDGSVIAALSGLSA